MTEFDDVIQLLKDERPQATELELDAIKQRVRRNAANPSRRSQSMKSRLAILGMLVAGMLFSTAGAGLAISGVTQSGDNAAVSQYGTPTPTPVCTATPTGDTTPTSENGGGTNNASPDACGEGGVLPAEETNAPTSDSAPSAASGGGVSPAEESQPVRQQAAAAQTSQLPFTGFAAIPVLLGGLALLSGGLVLRRRTRNE
jgi:LPXTG-motif cell wall-anchored protein